MSEAKLRAGLEEIKHYLMTCVPSVGYDNHMRLMKRIDEALSSPAEPEMVECPKCGYEYNGKRPS